MAIPKITGAQRDFSSGELDVSMKRADENPEMKTGARQLSNWRILNSKAVQNRSGRGVRFIEPGRVDQILMSPGNTFYLAFGQNYLRVYNAVGTKVYDSGADMPWTLATAQNITWTYATGSTLSIYIAFADGAPNNPPQVLTWDGVSQTSTWTQAEFAEQVLASGQKRTLFYRISPPNVLLLPSAVSGAINITFIPGILSSAMIGTRLRYCGRQLLITSVSTSQVGTALVIETLPPAQVLTVSTTVGVFNIGDELKGSTSGASGIITSGPHQQTLDIATPTGTFSPGDSATGATSGATGIVTAVISVRGGEILTVTLSTGTLFQAAETVNGSHGSATVNSVTGGTLVVQLLQSDTNFVDTFIAETVVSPSGSATVTAVSTTTPQAVSVWDDEVMNLFRGYPASVFFDQGRLGFCNFPSVPSGIAWSAIGVPTDFYVAAQPDNAIFELAPSKSQVYFVVPGPESSEFVFCDNKIYYIPISVTNPLEPGTVAFNILSSDGAANVQPRAVEEIIFYVTAGGLRVKAVIAPGAYYRPFNTVDVTENHTHLFSNVIALAAPTGDGQFPERYCYALNSGGGLVVGKFSVHDGQLVGAVGWLPWSGAGTITWASAFQGTVIFTTSYAPNGVTPVSVIEQLDDNRYTDATISPNSLPAALAPPGGKGPLWWIPGGSVTLMDQGYRMMGTYQIDANGFIIPQNNAGENLASATLLAGQPWTAALEPFVPDASPGQSVHQRMFKRRVSRMAVYVSNSTGFLMARLFSGPLTRTSPALGAIMNSRRVDTWNQDDDPTQAPPLREEAQRWRPIGRSYDPRVAVIKDTPGPLLVHEIGLEASV